jgi:pimeloyl-ACP methyl ester carboxylesterase/ketosteroid isomerase-like protein
MECAELKRNPIIESVGIENLERLLVYIDLDKVCESLRQEKVIGNQEEGDQAMSLHHETGQILFALLCIFSLVPNQTISAQPPRRLALAPCRLSGVDGEVRCGNYEIYEDRVARKGRKIALKIALLPALSATPAPDPLFIIAGGPGAPATEMADFAARVFAKVRRERDIVLVDQRGTGGSNGLSCDLYGETRQGHLGDLFPPGAIKACRAEWERRADLRLYTTPIAMDDLDDVRAALGYERINLYGTSYGTRAAQVYLRQYPNRVRSMILKGMTPLSDIIPAVMARDAQRSLEIVFDDCAREEACRKAFPNLKQEFAEVLARFERGSVAVEMIDEKTGKTELVEISRGAFATTLRSLLQVPTAIARVPMMIHQAYKGDFSPFAINTHSIRSGATKGLYYGMFLSVINAEDLSFIDPKHVAHESAGTFMGDYYYQQLVQACGLLPRGAVPRNYHDPVRSDVPVLFVSGHLDSSTPPANAEKAAQHLPNSLRIVGRYASHSYTGFTRCIDNLMAEFINRGSVKGLDTSCVADLPQTPFQTSSTQLRREQPLTNNDEQELRKLENDWLSTYISGDKATYDRIVADGFTGTDESAVKRTKEQDRALLPSAPVAGSIATNDEVQVRLYGETAIVTGRIVTKIKAGDQEIPGFTTRFTDTWLKRQERWQIVARHYSRVPLERKAVKLDAKIFDSYIGDYEPAPGFNFTVFKEGDSLWGQNPGQPKFELYPESEVVFFMKGTPALFLFLRNEKGQVSQMFIIQDGRIMPAKKTK